MVPKKCLEDSDYPRLGSNENQKKVQELENQLDKMFASRPGICLNAKQSQRAM